MTTLNCHRLAFLPSLFIRDILQDCLFACWRRDFCVCHHVTTAKDTRTHTVSRVDGNVTSLSYHVELVGRHFLHIHDNSNVQDQRVTVNSLCNVIMSLRVSSLFMFIITN